MQVYVGYMELNENAWRYNKHVMKLNNIIAWIISLQSRLLKEYELDYISVPNNGHITKDPSGGYGIFYLVLPVWMVHS
jgi:hypothetical protein